MPINRAPIIEGGNMSYKMKASDRPTSRYMSALLALLLVVLTGMNSRAQSITGDISGNITDTNGAVVVGAEITITNTGTGSVRSAVTDGRGEFRVAFLPVADY